MGMDMNANSLYCRLLSGCLWIQTHCYKLGTRWLPPPPSQSFCHPPSQGPFSLKYKQNIGGKMEFRMEVRT
jgi:hypothetical protein